jgi:hypothetical protein
MKLRKKIKKRILVTVAVMLFIQPLFLQYHLIASQTYCEPKILQKENYLPHSSEKQNFSYYIDITPEKLSGLNLKELFRAIVEYAYETNTLHELPQGLINCCKLLENDASSLHIVDLAEALPVIIEKVMNPTLLNIILRMSRPDAPGFGDGSIVGPLLECNIDKVVQLLDQLLRVVNHCCATLEFDFSGVFTSLENLVASATCDFSAVFSVLNTNFNGTFTELNDIKDTLTTCCAALGSDFSGVFTSLENLVANVTCDITTAFSRVNSNFNGTYTELNDIQNTLTICCAALESDFSSVFTVLENLVISVTCDMSSIFTANINFAGTFTALADIQNTLTTCCAELESDFSSIFTVLENLIISATCDISSIFTANINFAGTFTALADIKNTLTTCCAALESDFDGTFTTLSRLIAGAACDFSPIFTLLTTGFEGTFSLLADINSTLTLCCATLESDFNGTFSVISHLMVSSTCDFTPIFTVVQDIKNTLTTCCAALEFDFDGTFTSIANIMITATCDFTPIFTILQDIKSSITACCNNFNSTFTLLNDIKNTLTLCCTQLEADFDGTFTILAHITTPTCDLTSLFTVIRSIKDTMTICCAALESDFEGTFTALANVKVIAKTDLTAVFTSLTDIKNTLTTCCATIQHDFDGTFTALADLKNTVLITQTRTAESLENTFTVLNVLKASICNPTIISQSNFGPGGATPFVISTTGVYIFGENITFNPAAASQAIIITTSAVTLDLQCFTLQQGNATAGVDGIRVNNGLKDVTIKNGRIANFTRAGITIQSSNLRTIIQNVTLLLCGVRGIELLGSIGNLIQNAEIEHCMIDSCSQGAAGDFAFLVQQTNNCKISYCNVRNCGVSSHTLSAMRLDTCTELKVNTITISDNTGSNVIGMQLLVPTSLTFIHCIIRANNATAALTGIDVSGATNQFNTFTDCHVIGNSAGTNFIGINLAANTLNNIFENPTISWNNGASAFGINLSGGVANNKQNSFRNSIICANSSTTGSCIGFVINGSDAGILAQSVISYNTSTAAQAIGINFLAPGGNNWELSENQISLNTGLNPANSFGILRSAGSNNLFISQYGFRNGGAAGLVANQMSGLSIGAFEPNSTTTLAIVATNFWVNQSIVV